MQGLNDSYLEKSCWYSTLTCLYPPDLYINWEIFQDSLPLSHVMGCIIRRQNLYTMFTLRSNGQYQMLLKFGFISLLCFFPGLWPKAHLKFVNLNHLSLPVSLIFDQTWLYLFSLLSLLLFRSCYLDFKLHPNLKRCLEVGFFFPIHALGSFLKTKPIHFLQDLISVF